jgi:hypothetical protein
MAESRVAGGGDNSVRILVTCLIGDKLWPVVLRREASTIYISHKYGYKSL